MAAVVRGRHDRERPLTWIQIGAVAGPAAAVPSAALRASGLRIVGSGQGSVPTRDILAELPGLAAELTKGTFRLDARAVPLADAEAVWSATDGTRRTVVAPCRRPRSRRLRHTPRRYRHRGRCSAGKRRPRRSCRRCRRSGGS